MAESADHTQYADPRVEMQDYLDFMLRKATEPRPALPDEPAEALDEPYEAGPADEPSAEEDTVPEPEADTVDCLSPDSVESEFPGLLFRVRDMDMAAPLVHLGGIATLTDGALQPVVGQAPWFIGLMRWNGRTIRVIDTASLLMDADDAAQTPPDDGKCRGYRCVVVLHGTDWGLAIDAPGASRRLRRDDVRWRRQRGGRPWLAGTLSDSLCSLLDTGAIIDRLAPLTPPEQELQAPEAGSEFAKQTLTAENSAITAWSATEY